MEREEIKMGIWIFLGKAKKNTKKADTNKKG